MTKSLHRPIATLLLVVLVLLQAGAVLAAHAYHADGSVAIVTHAGGADGDSARAATDRKHPLPAFDTLVVADCAEHCGGAAILTARGDPPTILSRWVRIPPPAIRLIAAPPERLERPPKAAVVPI